MTVEEGPSSKSCFVISPIGAAASETRRRSDKILKHVIRPVAEAKGYTASRADEIENSGMITSQIIHRISTDDLVVADLTELNPNVFYELALRHALRKPFIQMAEDGQKLPFDVQGLRTIFIDHTDLDSVAAAKESLGKSIEAIHNGAEIETPMSFAVRLDELRDSSDPEKKGIAEVLESIQRLERMIGANDTESPSYKAVRHDSLVLRKFVEELAADGRISQGDIVFSQALADKRVSHAFSVWLQSLEKKLPPTSRPVTFDEEPPF